MDSVYQRESPPDDKMAENPSDTFQGCANLNTEDSKNRLDQFLQDHNSVRFQHVGPNNSTDVCFSLGTSSSSGGKTTKCNSCSSAFSQLMKTEFCSGGDWGKADEESKLDKGERDDSDDISWIVNLFPSSSQQLHQPTLQAQSSSSCRWTLRPPRDRVYRHTSSSVEQPIGFEIDPTPIPGFLTNEEWISLREQRYRRLDVTSNHINTNRRTSQELDVADSALTDRIALVQSDYGSRHNWWRRRLARRINRIPGSSAVYASVWMATLPWRIGGRSSRTSRNRNGADDDTIWQTRFRWPEPGIEGRGEDNDDDRTSYWSTGTAMCDELSCFDDDIGETLS